MILVAVIGWSAYVLVAFALRTLWHLHQTGSSGFVGLRRDAPAWERIAGVLLAFSFLLSLAAPFVGTPLFHAPLAGAITIAVAIAGTFLAQLSMSRSWRVGVDPGARTELVTRGPFAHVRNPIFTGMIAASLGIALACPTPLAWLSPVLLAIGLELQVRWVEEPYLLRVHAGAYRAYAARTGRFVPGIGRLDR